MPLPHTDCSDFRSSARCRERVVTVITDSMHPVFLDFSMNLLDGRLVISILLLCRDYGCSWLCHHHKLYQQKRVLALICLILVVLQKTAVGKSSWRPPDCLCFLWKSSSIAVAPVGLVEWNPVLLLFFSSLIQHAVF